MTTFHPSPFAGESDLPRLGELIAACQAVDQLESPYTHQDMREELVEPTVGWRREVALWQSGSDLLGVACLWVPPASEKPDAFFWFVVHPSARDGTLVRELVVWADEQGAALAGRDATLTTGATEEDRWRMLVVPTFDFAPVRYFLRMSRRLDDALPVLPPPAGYLIRPLAGPDEVEAWVDLYNAAFADHWEHIHLTPDERRLEMARPSYRGDLDLVAVAPDGTIAAFCAAAIRELDDGGLEAWINLVGTHPAHRRRGLARAVLAAGLTALSGQGMTEAKLGVDAESPTGATSLYEALGFTVSKTITVFRRPILPTAPNEIAF
ncbi:MAG: mycothiol synthase [Thermomicrobiales bacterium]|nr:mycothiol synthase [Thermomicrobiales bacterium]